MARISWAARSSSTKRVRHKVEEAEPEGTGVVALGAGAEGVVAVDAAAVAAGTATAVTEEIETAAGRRFLRTK